MEEAKGVCVSGAPSEGVRSDEVEMVVREVIREKVAEAVRQAHRHKREEETVQEIKYISCIELNFCIIFVFVCAVRR